MLLGSKIALDNAAEVAPLFDGFQSPVLLLTPTDIFGRDAEQIDVPSGIETKLKTWAVRAGNWLGAETSLEEIERGLRGQENINISRRLEAAIDRYAGNFKNLFKAALGKEGGRDQIVGLIKQRKFFALPIADASQQGFEHFYPGLAFVPGDQVNSKLYLADRVGIVDADIDCDTGSAEFWKFIITAHELFHLLKPGMLEGLLKLDVGAYFEVQKDLSCRPPDQRSLYFEILSDFVACVFSGKRDPTGKFRQMFTDARMVYAINGGHTNHATGLALNYLHRGGSLPQLSDMLTASEELASHVRTSLPEHPGQSSITSRQGQAKRRASELGESLRNVLANGDTSPFGIYCAGMTSNALVRLCSHTRPAFMEVAQTLNLFERIIYPTMPEIDCYQKGFAYLRTIAS